MTNPLPMHNAHSKPKRIWPWYRPMVRKFRINYFRQFPRKKVLHGGWLHRRLGNRLFDPGLWHPTRETFAWGLTIGVFIGMLPAFGLQIVLSIGLCFLFRANLTAAVVGTFISNPLTSPGLLYLQYLVGRLLSQPPDPGYLSTLTGTLRIWIVHGKPLLFGAMVTAVLAAAITYPLTLLLWSGISKIGKQHKSTG